jgi:hypothetical protein
MKKLEFMFPMHSKSTSEGHESHVSVGSLSSTKSVGRLHTYNLVVKTTSWPNEGRGLLHVLSPMLYCKDFKIRAANGSYSLCRGDTSVELVSSDTDTAARGTVIARLVASEQSVTIDMECSDDSDASSSNGFWGEVPRDTDGRIISTADILRFGSYKVKLVDVVLGDGQKTTGTFHPFGEEGGVSEQASTYSGSEGGSGPICRICFDPFNAAEEPSNPLVSPCLCSGSLRHIHVGCLRRWLDGQLQVKQFPEGGGSYFIRTILCEICKSEYSKSVYRSILISRPNVPHIVLEDLLNSDAPSSPSRPTSRVHIIPISTQSPVRIGRSKENDLVLNDISVSRFHGTILLTPDKRQIRLIDLQSKFGTLVQLPSRIEIPILSEIFRVQIGPSLIEITTTCPNRFERILPDRLLAKKGAIKILSSKSPSDHIMHAEKSRRSSDVVSPASPAATLNESPVRSPRVRPDIELPSPGLNT